MKNNYIYVLIIVPTVKKSVELHLLSWFQAPPFPLRTHQFIATSLTGYWGASASAQADATKTQLPTDFFLDGQYNLHF